MRVPRNYHAKKSTKYKPLTMKKSQIRIGESVAILFIFLIFVVIGFSFYAKIQKASFSSQLDENINMIAIETAQKASFLPELQCSSKNIIVDNCVDVLKVEAFNGMVNNNAEYPNLVAYYYDVFGFSTIIVEEIYPEKKEWAIYNNTLNDSGSIFTPVPILIYDARNETYSLGVLRVTYYPITIT